MGLGVAVGNGVYVGIGVEVDIVAGVAVAMGVLAGISVGGIAVGSLVGVEASVATGVSVGATTATSGLSSPVPLNMNTAATVIITPTMTSPMATGKTGKRLLRLGSYSTCRWAMVPSFSMKNCSWPGLPEKAVWGRKDRVMM